MREQKSLMPQKPFIIVLHSSMPVHHPLIKGVIIKNSWVNEINQLIESYGDKKNPSGIEKIRQIYFYGSLEDSLKITEEFKGIIKVFTKSKSDIIKHSKQLKERQNKWYICPDYPLEKIEDVSFITSMGMAVDLLPKIDHLEIHFLKAILKFYLHNPALTIPIEPFHSILMSKLKRQPLQLWNLHLVFPGLFFHADEKGISDDPEQLIHQKYQYLLDQNNQDITIKQEKNSKSDLENYFENIPANHPECLSCKHFNCCFAWGKYKKDTCQKWKTLLDMIQLNVKEIERIQRLNN